MSLQGIIVVYWGGFFLYIIIKNGFCYMGVYLGIILFINFILNIIIYLIFLLLLIFYFIINYFIIPQIAMVKNFFPSKRGEGDEPLLRIKRGTRVPLQVVPLLGAIIVCYG